MKSIWLIPGSFKAVSTLFISWSWGWGGYSMCKLLIWLLASWKCCCRACVHVNESLDWASLTSFSNWASRYRAVMSMVLYNPMSLYICFILVMWCFMVFNRALCQCGLISRNPLFSIARALCAFLWKIYVSFWFHFEISKM